MLTPDLLTPKWRAMVEKGDHPTTGHCYAAAEAAFHLLGGKDAGYQARVANLGKDANGETITHWWLEGPDGRIDPTSAQFTPDKLKEAYSVGKPIGFLTKDPSKRAKTIMDRVGKK